MARNRQYRNQTNVTNHSGNDTARSAPPRSEDVAARAYELYERRGGEHGRDWDDWFAAERELQQSGEETSPGTQPEVEP